MSRSAYVEATGLKDPRRLDPRRFRVGGAEESVDSQPPESFLNGERVVRRVRKLTKEERELQEVHEVVVDLTVIDLRPKKRAQWFTNCVKAIAAGKVDVAGAFGLMKHDLFMGGFDHHHAQKCLDVLKGYGERAFSNKQYRWLHNTFEDLIQSAAPKRGLEDADSEQPAKKRDVDMVEYRIDSADGVAYSKAEFLEQYGGVDEWNNSVVAGTFSANVA